jgi:hypothetical protein
MGMKVNGTSGLTFPDTTTLASAGQASVRAWVNFNGTGTPAIRAAYNLASITDNGAGDYTLNFTTALPNANYAVTGSADFIPGVTALSVVTVRTYTTSNITIDTSNSANGAKTDPTFVNVAVFR